MISTSVARPHDRDALVRDYRYLCTRGARKFLRPTLERADLEQVAAVGLIKAARRFDPAMQTPFEAYAWIAIIGELMHHVRDNEYAIRLPRRLATIDRHVAGATNALAARFGRQPNDDEIASALSLSASHVRQARHARAAIRPVCFDATPAIDRQRHEHAVEDRFFIEHAFASLEDIERRIVSGVYFLGFTQAQLASALRLSPKRVSRIHRSALARMRDALAS